MNAVMGIKGSGAPPTVALSSSRVHHLLHHIHSILAPQPYTIAGWKKVPAEEPLERAEANGYKQGAHQAEDSIKDNTKYVKRTPKDQNWALGRYDK